MSTDKRIRPGVKRRLVDVAGHVLDERKVKALYTWDGQPVAQNTLYLGVVEGNTEPESISGGAPLEADDFLIDANLRVLGKLSPEAAEQLCMDIVNDLARVLAAHPRLLNIPGLDDGDVASYLGLESIRIGAMDGPGHTIPKRGPMGGWCSWDFVCRSILDF